MNLKKIYKISLIIIFVIFLINLFTVDRDSKIFIQLKKNFTGIYHLLGFDEPNITQKIIIENGALDSSEIINANSFDINIVHSKDLKFDGKSAGIFIDKNNEIIFFGQQGYIIRNKTVKKIDLTDSYTPEKNGGLKGVFFINNNPFGLISSRSVNCYKSSIISLKDNHKLFETRCIPDDNIIDFNGLGGANVIKDNHLYLALGAPEAVSNEIRNLAQNDDSYYGKILKININEFSKKNIRNIEIYSKGHRNPQGLINYNDKIISTEHGPFGGDEINIISYKNNFGWPITSYGTKYFKDDNTVNNTFGDGQSFSFDANIMEKFKEPIYAFIPSEAISDLTKCPEKLINYYNKPCLILSSLKAGSLFIVLLNKNYNRVISIEKISIGLRLRHFIKNMDNSIYDGKDHLYVSADREGVLKIQFKNFR